jgi:hypothetical protein
VTFENRQKKKYSRSYFIDPLQYFGRSWIGNDKLSDVGENLHKIERHLDHVVSGFDRLSVDVYSSKDREKEQKSQEILLKNNE